MKHIIQIVGNRKAWIKLSQEAPLMGIVPALLVGQWLGFCLLIEAGGVYLLSGGLFAVSLGMIFRGRAICFLIIGALFTLPLLITSTSLPDSDSSIVAEVDERPRYRRAGEVGLSIRIIDSELNSESEVSGNRYICKAVYLPWKNIYGIKKGERFILRGVFREVKIDRITGYGFNLFRHAYSGTCRISYTKRLGSKAGDLFGRIREVITDRVRKDLGVSEDTELFLSMSLGVRDMISSQTERVFKKTGLAHLLVVSGFQVTLIFYLLDKLFRKVLARIPYFRGYIQIGHFSGLLAFLCSVVFVLVAGIEGSSLRAALAAFIMLLSRLLERGGGFFQGMLLSLMILNIIWPGCFLEPGVQLTYAALTGIWLGIAGREKGVIKYLKICFYASCATSVVTVCWFSELSLMGLILNPLLAPLASIVSCKIGFAGITLLNLGIDPSGYLLQICICFTGALKGLLHYLAEFSFVMLEGASAVFGAILMSLFVLRRGWVIYKTFLLKYSLI